MNGDEGSEIMAFPATLFYLQFQTSDSNDGTRMLVFGDSQPFAQNLDAFQNDRMRRAALDILLTLMGQVSHTRRSRASSADALENLQEIDSKLCEDQKCSICLEKYQERKKIVELECGHRFHRDCLVEGWLNTHNTCPICRYEIPLANSSASEEADRKKRMATRSKEYAQRIRSDSLSEKEAIKCQQPKMLQAPKKRKRCENGNKESKQNSNASSTQEADICTRRPQKRKRGNIKATRQDHVEISASKTTSTPSSARSSSSKARRKRRLNNKTKRPSSHSSLRPSPPKAGNSHSPSSSSSPCNKVIRQRSSKSKPKREQKKRSR